MPRRQQPDYSWGYALDSGLGLRIYRVKGRTKGIAQQLRGTLRRGIATAAHQAAKPKRSNEVFAKHADKADKTRCQLVAIQI